MIVVIGGSSFIGAYAVQALVDDGFEVLATGRSSSFGKHYAEMGVEYISYELSDASASNALPDKGVEAVILLAALLPANSGANLVDEDNAAEYVLVNTLGTARLLEYCRRMGCRLVTTTSYADVKLGWSADEPITEQTPRGFEMSGDHCAYVISKNAASDLCEYYNQQHGMRNVVLRLPPVYGVGPHGDLLVDGKRRKSGIALFVEQAKQGLPVTVYGDASASRDIVYVKDVADAIVHIVKSDVASGLYNIGSGRSTSLLEQAEAIAEVFEGPGGRSAVSVDPSRENGVVAYSMDISKARRDFGYEPRFASFRDLMADWKGEEERGTYASLFEDAR